MQLWLLGGYFFGEGVPGQTLNEVWNSSDGKNWSKITASAPWSPRCPNSLVFNSKIWIFGGKSDNWIGDIWYSANGTSWTKAKSSTPWDGEKYKPTFAVFNGKLSVMYSVTNSTAWYSSDSVTWKECNLPGDSQEFAATRFNSRIWLSGGAYRSGEYHFTENEVYSIFQNF
ncbi:MAG: hypothetical protein DKM50_05210 [Candidatus Margulisiibacteriota bacterium]|nr:MAG: hypothetical protein A2X43_08590 [Candidatus Margulisbacteria bacterium GWD2_39_127]OGI05106.1 MAG: hypothetical protein A2X42_12605 [Candidatus Margulisbacteria bacterium GWF2_38_17]OGI09192.1 MAG: hypothetical protein A2X41_01285 [Candidatus Margulisbacteria bacterium GWE2_39_32]PZM81869.1 MAG: hypothetical protein DKM50_05210 [Candidatus Margulisiibacteriota bacterium]HAR63084.1 hypothetical protein [Candidatus Margulisiibacteriota bacterium]